MNGYSSSDWAFILVAVVVAMIFVAMYFSVIRPFNERRRYIKMEMHRSKSSAGKRYWQHELKRLYWSLVPFVKKK